MKRFRMYLWVAVLLGTVAGCDSAPGAANPEQVAPTVEPLGDFISPKALDIELLPVENGLSSSSLSVQIQIEDADDDVQTVFAVVQSLVAGEDPIGQLEQSVPGNGVVTLTVPLSVPEGAAGQYQVAVFAADSRGAMSNRVYGMIELVAGNEAPFITSIEIPQTIVRPAEGQPAISVPIVVHAGDPDGAQNILKVEVLVNGAFSFRLCDDGGVGICNAGFGVGSGDVLAGDGAYTLTIQLDSQNAAGDNLFQFTVTDRAGLTSQIENRTITLQ